MNIHVHAVADSQHRHAQFEDFRIDARGAFFEHAVRSARKDDALRHVFGELRRGRVETDYFGENLLLADSARNQLRVLGTVVEDDYTLDLGMVLRHSVVDLLNG